MNPSGTAGGVALNSSELRCKLRADSYVVIVDPVDRLGGRRPPLGPSVILGPRSSSYRSASAAKFGFNGAGPVGERVLQANRQKHAPVATVRGKERTGSRGRTSGWTSKVSAGGPRPETPHSALVGVPIPSRRRSASGALLKTASGKGLGRWNWTPHCG